MKIFFILLAFIISWGGFSQRIIKNELTREHIRTDGTNLYLIPPNGFVRSTQPTGFSNLKSNANIIIHGIKQPIEAVHNEMSLKKLKGQGLGFISEEKVSVDGLAGYLIKTSQQNIKGNFLNYTLLFQDPDLPQTHVVQCKFPAGNKLMGKVLEQSILTTLYVPLVERSSLPFSIEFKQHGFAYWKYENGVHHYKAIEKDEAELVIMADYFLVNSTQPDIIFSNKMRQLPFAAMRLDEKGIEVIALDGLTGLRGTIKARNKSGEAEYIYQVLLNQGRQYFLIQGISHTAEGLSKLKQVIESFKKKS